MVLEASTGPWAFQFSSDLSGKLGGSFLFQIITDRPGFHDETAIYPVGYCSTRAWASMRAPDQECLYTCQIKDGGAQPQVPALRITAGFCFFFPSCSENLLCDRHSVSK